MTLGRYVRNELDYNGDPPTLRDIARSLASIRQKVSTMKDPDPIIVDQLNALITTWSTKLRMSTLSLTPEKALSSLNEYFEKAGWSEMHFDTFQDAYQVAYEEYQGMIAEIIRRSGNEEEVAKFEHILQYSDELADAVAAYEERQRPLDDITLPTRKDRRKHRMDWTQVLA